MRTLTPVLCLLAACEGTVPQPFDPDLLAEVEALEGEADPAIAVVALDPTDDRSASVAPAVPSLAGPFRGVVACASGHSSRLSLVLVEAESDGTLQGKAAWNAGALEVAFGIEGRVTGVTPGGRVNLVFDAGHCAEEGVPARCPDLEEAIYTAQAQSLVGHAGIPTSEGVERCLFEVARR